MQTLIQKTSTNTKNNSMVYFSLENCQKNETLSNIQIKYLKNELSDNGFAALNLLSKHIIIIAEKEKNSIKRNELLRRKGKKLTDYCNQNKLTQIVLLTEKDTDTLSVSEGAVLANYQFLKYKSDKKENSLKQILIKGKLNEESINELNNTLDAVYFARTLVNEPVSYLDAVQLAKEAEKMAKEHKIKVEVLTKSKIESLKMGGLLAVNKGSEIPPTFTILEYKPKNAKNKNPLILVGKGVVYDTGGLSLKPTPNSMDLMKSDMGGAAAMLGAVKAIAANNLPYHVIALIPATDNRPGKTAYAPGDIIEMHNGIKVEVLNTDAEGRMILADALSYAQKYNPELVIDAATLTGAAARAIGKYGIVGMTDKATKEMKQLKNCGEEVYERIAEMPFWDEYDDLIKSDIADIKNIGGAEAGAITAGKFLNHFTNYKWIHLDIAGPAYLTAPYQYHPVGGTGVGVRLIYNFVKSLCI
jgi:leucyl aminopeptidase